MKRILSALLVVQVLSASTLAAAQTKPATATATSTATSTPTSTPTPTPTPTFAVAPGPVIVTTAPAADGPDTIVLKDGQVVRGWLRELRVGDQATIQLAGGQVAMVRWDGIARIERSGQPMTIVTNATATAPAAQPVAVAPIPPPPPEYLPRTLPYDEDKPVPSGYHVEKKTKTGLLVAGSVLTGIGVAGIAYIQANDSRSSVRDSGSAVWGLLFLGPGVPMLLVGLFSKKKVLERNTPVDVGFSIDPKRGGGTVMLGRTF